MKDKGPDEESVTIDQCYICKDWWLKERMKTANVPDQTGYVAKPICPICLKNVRERI